MPSAKRPRFEEDGYSAYTRNTAASCRDTARSSWQHHGLMRLNHKSDQLDKDNLVAEKSRIVDRTNVKKMGVTRSLADEGF